MKTKSLDLTLMALRHSWSEETGQPHDGLWDPNNPAKGQCCVSSLLIMNYFGGELIRGTIHSEGTSIIHYWNELPQGEWIDSTRSQFGNDYVLESWERKPDVHLYQFADTIRKYEILRERVERYEERLSRG